MKHIMDLEYWHLASVNLLTPPPSALILPDLSIIKLILIEGTSFLPFLSIFTGRADEIEIYSLRTEKENLRRRTDA